MVTGVVGARVSGWRRSIATEATGFVRVDLCYEASGGVSTRHPATSVRVRAMIRHSRAPSLRHSGVGSSPGTGHSVHTNEVLVVGYFANPIWCRGNVVCRGP